MPSKSPEQARLMRAVAHGWHKPGGGGPSKAVAQEFVNADKRVGHFADGGSVMNKGYSSSEQCFAQGGAVLGRTRDFMKMKDEFRDPDEGNPRADKDQLYGKAGPGAGKGMVNPPAAKGKTLKAIKPHS